MLSFHNTVSVFTGAASGLGFGLAREIIERQGFAVLIDIDRQRLEESCRNLPEGSYEFFTADVTDSSRIGKVF